ncbi:hypothetical protein [Methylobacterium radiotolerans]|uniref:hypothetical protein n=1 Tax=Methylobacterium radiotolerans TaxID=31998 RepID=UPI0038D20573
MSKSSMGAALARLTATPPAESNQQVADFAHETEERVRSRSLLLGEVLSDLSDSERSRYIDALVEERHHILNHTTSIKNHVVEIGRSLNRLKATLPGDTMTRLLTSYDRNERDGTTNESALPFSASTASKYMKIARAVDTRMFENAFQACDRIFTIDCLPDYNAAYELALLEEPWLEEAARQDLIRPDLTVRAAQAFKRKFKQGTRSSPGAGFREIERITSEMRKLASRWVVLEGELKAAAARAGMAPPDLSTSKGCLDVTPSHSSETPDGGGEVPDSLATLAARLRDADDGAVDAAERARHAA